MRNGPAMSTVAPERHEVVVLALPDVTAFEIGLASRFLGAAVDGDGRRLYRVRVATMDGGPVRTSGGYSVLPEHDASIAATAQTLVAPAGSPPSGVRDGGVPAWAAQSLDRRLPADLPPHLPGAGRSLDVTGASPPEEPRGLDVWLSGLYRRRPRSSGAAGIDVGLRLRHRGAPGCPTSR